MYSNSTVKTKFSFWIRHTNSLQKVDVFLTRRQSLGVKVFVEAVNDARKSDRDIQIAVSPLIDRANSPTLP